MLENQEEIVYVKQRRIYASTLCHSWSSLCSFFNLLSFRPIGAEGRSKSGADGSRTSQDWPTSAGFYTGRREREKISRCRISAVKSRWCWFFIAAIGDLTVLHSSAS